MLAEKDPLAISLLARYNQVPMPNLRLGAREAESLLVYIEQESQRIERHRRAGHDKESLEGSHKEHRKDPHAGHGSGQHH